MLVEPEFAGYCEDGGGIDATSVCASDILSIVDELITVLPDEGLDEDCRIDKRKMNFN